MGGPGRPAGRMGFVAMPAAKSKDFRGSFRRLLGELRPERRSSSLVMVLAIVSVVFAIVGPKILGNATNILFEGVVGKQLPAGRDPGRRSSRRSGRAARTTWPTCWRA